MSTVLATLCYVKHRGQTLMLHRVKRKHDIHNGKWNALGGKLERAETPEECVIREVKEESGLVIKNPKLVGILTFPGFNQEEDWYVYVFAAKDFTGNLKRESEEGILEWVNDSKLLELNLWEGDSLFLKWMEEGRFFSGKFIYRNEKLVDHSVVFY